MTDERLAEILGRARAVLFDFDGPICSIFSGIRAADVARDLRQLLIRGGHQVTPSIAKEDDPLEILRYSERFGVDVVREVDDALTESELAAVLVAEPTVGSSDCIEACVDRGRRVAVVTNNSAIAATEYLVLNGLRDRVDVIVGRAYCKPHKMKPNPTPVLSALDRLPSKASGTVLVGDSVSDIDACRAAGVACIAYANRPRKLSTLSAADIVIDDMSRLARLIQQADSGHHS